MTKVTLASRSSSFLPGELGEPVVDGGERSEHGPAEEHVVEVGDDEIGVVELEIERRLGQHDAGEPAEQEADQEPDGEQHGRVEPHRAPEHRADPVEELDPRRHRHQQGHDGEEGQKHGTGGVHVVGPHTHRQRADGQGGEHHALVTEHGLAREGGDDLGGHPEERQRQDVDLGVAEEPEQVLPQDGLAAVGGVEEMGPEVPVRPQQRQARR